MDARTILSALDFGSPVAEYEKDLERYFVQTNVFNTLTSGRADIIAGDKGTGKSAIFRFLNNRYPSIKELSNTALLCGFNDRGSPIFQRLTETAPISESRHVTIWKTYILSLVGNFIIQLYEGAYTASMERLERRSVRKPDHSDHLRA